MTPAPGTGFQRQKGFDLLVLGGGIAGLTAAWHGARLGISVALVEKGPLFGGQVATLGTIDDFPSTVDQSGTELASRLLVDAKSFGASVSEDSVLGIRSVDGGFAVQTGHQELRAKQVVVATGGRFRKLELPEATALEGRGVSHCATCDGAFFRDSAVIVVGGGNGALQAALHLVNFCRSVTLIVRGRLKARQAYINAASKQSRLAFLWDSVVEGISGTDTVSGVRVKNLKNGDVLELACTGIFPLIGVEPNSEFIDGFVERTDAGHIRVDQEFATGIRGVHAIGAVRAGFSGSLASAAGEGAAVAETIARTCRI